MFRRGRAGEITSVTGPHLPYRSDPDLKRMHAHAPWVVTFDDHE
ncbi:alkaline phosphatase D family protein, partial [Streptomyces sp. NPDC052127]